MSAPSVTDNESGQAMVEYALIVALLMGGLVVMGWSFIPEFLKALQEYLEFHYVILNLPIP